MKQYNLLNTLMGWVVFAIAAITYILTLEPTASFWDCGEFIASAYKLEVGHPPGNPIFMLTGRFFANFASDPSQVAYMLNLMSALLSAGTILFLFWTITHLAKKLIVPDDKTMTSARMITILACGVVGALAYTWSDTFWYSAVEGEVYAYSSFCTAVVFWLILKWESVADEPHSEKYLILIAYIMGVSIAVHLLNLLCIPAIVLVYYYRKFSNISAKGSLVALLVSFGIIALLLFGIVPGFVKVAGWFELLCVNVLHMPYNTGVVIYFLLTMSIIGWTIFETFRRNNQLRTRILFLCSVALSGMPFLTDNIWIGIFLCIVLAGVIFYTRVSYKLINTVMAALLVILIGYSSYALILIRSTANTPMDQNSPEDIFTLASYLNREQYGETPLLYGKTYVSKVKRINGEAQTKTGKAIYQKDIKSNPEEPDRYVVTGNKESYIYDDASQMLFPRMHSDKPNHIAAYREWTGASAAQKPTFAQNIQFFLDYQLNHMYWRYFLWNFAGRQNDIQGHGEVDKGNWITGINAIDKYRVGDASNLPTEMAENPGRNVFYMLPLILGIIGLLYQAFAGKRGIEQFWVTFFLFFMTGIAIVIYLNQTPYQPRERDYAYAGSFYAWTIWIGLGVAAIMHGLTLLFKKANIKNELIPATLASLICLCVPLQMVSQTWDDHDRSGRYIARDFGMNYLSSVEPNAIIFTNGDNDTFPLWYAQEVEGYRTDVRVCNLSYFQTDWYADQMKRPAYESESLPISASRDIYAHDKMAYAYILPINDKLELSAGDALQFLYSKDPRTKNTQYGEINHIPSNKIFIPVDSASAVANAGVPAGYESEIVSRIEPNLHGKNGLYFYEIASLDMINSNIVNGWKRPIYYAVTVSNDLYLGLQDYFVLTGLAQRIVPLKSNVCGGVDTERMYDNMMNKFRWGGLDTATPENPIYLDENIRRMCQTTRVMFSQLIGQLIVEGKTDKALAALNMANEKIPAWLVPYESLAIQMANFYIQLGEKEKAAEILNAELNRSIEYLAWYSTLTSSQLRSVADYEMHYYVLQAGLDIFQENGMTTEAERIYAQCQANGLI